MNKLTSLLIALAILSIAQTASADPYLINLNYTSSSKSYTYDDNTYTEFVPATNNVITELEISLDDAYNDTAVSVQLGPDTYYNLTSTKSAAGLFKQLRQTLTVSGVTVFDDTASGANVLPNNDNIYIQFDEYNFNTTFDADMIGGAISMPKVEGAFIDAMPSSDVIIYGQTNFSVKITVKDDDTINSISHLGAFSRWIYNTLNAIPVVGNGIAAAILQPLVITELFFALIQLIVTLLYVYPYCLGIYIMTGGNIVGAVKGRSIREILFAMRDYYVWVGEKGAAIIKFIVNGVMRLLNTIANLI